MHKRINLYFFGDTGSYDEYSPVYVCNKKYAPEILYEVAHNKPFTISKEEIIKKFGVKDIEFDNIINSLKFIKAIDEIDNKYKLNFTVFLEEDMEILNRCFLNIGKEVGQKNLDKKELIYSKISELSNYNSFSKERILYHIICDRIFDGTAFQFFTDKKVFLSSKFQPGNRDYMIFGYEDSDSVEEHSNKIFCSSNNYRTENFIFNSFGDSNGARKDMFRFFRRVQKTLENSTPFEELNLSYIRIIEDTNRDLAERCGQFIWKCIKNNVYYNEISEEEENITNFLKGLEYVSIDDESDLITCSIPIFEEEDILIIEKISNIILKEICDSVKGVFHEFEENALDTTPIRHGINIDEIALELWHQVFGVINEYLMKVKFVQAPDDIVGEGRYLRSFYKLNS